ncbi:MAG: hypothetical protein DMF24_09425 [Verrucomicrobia bacterium]|nr:MAG: hypothetical protein DMF24_09425 [Verrucomicrobiota bacterium]
MNRTTATQTTWLTKFANAQLLAGVLLLFCALTFYYFAVLRIDYRKTTLLDLGPYPDATEYFAQAKALRRDAWPYIQIGYEKLPSRYPFGYPMLMLPWLKILRGTDSVLAPFRTNQTIGLLLLLAVFAFYVYLAMPLTGGFAALLLATLPGFFTFCRSSLSEVSASLLIVLAFMFAYLGVQEGRRWKIYLSAIFLGLSLNVRLQSLFFAPLLLAMAILPVRGARLRWFFHCTAVPLVFVVAASPMLILNMIQFHSPFKTGYDLWASYFSRHHLLFCLPYIPRNALMLWRETTLQPLGYDAANIFGTGTSFVPAFVMLICVGLLFMRLSWFLCCAFVAGLSSFAATLCYLFGGDLRFYLPLLILLIAVAVLPVTWAAKNLFAGKRIVLALPVFILFAGACLGYPSRSGYNTAGIERCQARDAVHVIVSAGKSTQFVAQSDFARRLRRQSGIVLSDIDPVYLNALLPHSFVAAPIDGEHHYKWSYTWRYDRPEALAFVQHGLERSLPVYALFVSSDEVTTKQSRLPVIPGYDWRLLDHSDSKAAILELAPVGPNEPPPRY